MKIVFSGSSWADYLWWQNEDQKLARRLNELIDEICRHRFKGTGRPEPLRLEMAGWWSRRIDHENRLIYRVTGKGDEQALEIAACRFHYGRR